MVVDPVVTVDPVMTFTPVTRNPHIVRIPLPIAPAMHVVRLIAYFDIEDDCIRERSRNSGR